MHRKSLFPSAVAALFCLSTALSTANVRAATNTFDIDASGDVDALSDGLLVMRYLFGLRGSPLIQGAISATATRTSSSDIEAYLGGLGNTLDVDNNGSVDALTDGLLITRYLFGLRGTTLTQNAVGNGAQRSSSAGIETYLDPLSSTYPANCSINASPQATQASPVVAGTSVQLTASCANGVAPISFAWDNSVNTASQTVNPQVTTTYSATPTNANGTGIAFSRTVYIGTLTAPGNCTVSQLPDTSSSPVPAATSVQLTVSCSTGSAPTSCAWNSNIASTACSISIPAPPTTTTYQVSASNLAGTSNVANTTIHVQTASGGQDFCNPQLDNIYLNIWPGPSGQAKSSTFGFGQQKIAFQLAIPANAGSDPNKVGFMRLAEQPGSAVVTRDWDLSISSCDFQTGQYIFSGIGFADTAPYLSFTVNNPNGYKQAGASINLNPGDTIYLNVKNTTNGQNTCPFTNCDISLDLRY